MDDEHTPGNPNTGRAPIIERKQKPDGTWREYECTLLHREPGLVIVEFVMAKGGSIFGTPIDVPPGSFSHGWFWKRRPYNLYRMRRADGSLIAHRFDAVADVRFDERSVSYRDLVLDWWVLPDDTLIEEDRAELNELQAGGRISERDLEATHAAERAIYSRYRHIIDDVVDAERRLLGRS